MLISWISQTTTENRCSVEFSTLSDLYLEALSLFSERLAAAGYNPADEGRYARPFRILSEELYRVGGSFPRLTRESFGAGLPAGIEEISYSISMIAGGPWRVASSPRDPAATALWE
jgi:hypothetical protein